MTAGDGGVAVTRGRRGPVLPLDLGPWSDQPPANDLDHLSPFSFPHGVRPYRSAPSRLRTQAGGGPSLRAGVAAAVLAAVVWAAVPVSPITLHLSPPDRQARGGLPWLRVVDASRIVDEAGRTVLLRGFNSDALLEDGVRHAPLEDRDAALMEQAGFNVVRLPIAWSRLEPRRGYLDLAYLGLVARTVAMLNAHHLYVVLDMHILDWGPRFGGSGAPWWAALPLVPSLQWWPWESWRKHLDPAPNAATTYFWLSPDWQTDFDMVWRAVAARFRDDSGVVGYDLYNEPHPLPIPPRLFEVHWLWPWYARTIEAIASVDPNHLFIVEGILFGDIGTTIVPLRARDLVYSPHVYTGSLVPPSFSGDPRPLASHIRAQALEAGAVPAPMWTGEIGIDHRAAHAAEYVDAALDAYDDLDVGWAWWQWRENGWGVRTADGGAVDLPFLRHLARPYLAAAPWGVHASRGDGVHGALDLRVEAEHGSAPVVVSWPELTLGPPAVQGGCVAASDWEPQTARLHLELRPQAPCLIHLRAAG